MQKLDSTSPSSRLGSLLLAKLEQAAVSHGATTSVPADTPQVTQRQPVENPDDRRHVHAQMARESAAARARLLEAIKASQTVRHGSVGPEALS